MLRDDRKCRHIFSVSLNKSITTGVNSASDFFQLIINYSLISAKKNVPGTLPMCFPDKNRNWSSLFVTVTIGKQMHGTSGTVPWWRHQMETFSALLALCAGNSPVPGEFPTQRPVTRSFDVFFDLHPNKRLSKQWRGWSFETPSCPLWRHRNAEHILVPHTVWYYSFPMIILVLSLDAFHEQRHTRSKRPHRF